MGIQQNTGARRHRGCERYGRDGATIAQSPIPAKILTVPLCLCVLLFAPWRPFASLRSTLLSSPHPYHKGDGMGPVMRKADAPLAQPELERPGGGSVVIDK